MTLSNEQRRRYARHVVLPEIGEAGQQKLLASHVLIIGAGGLGSAAIAYLAAAGIGKITIIEPDRVELSNLQRQILFETADIGRPKAEAARDRVHEVNPDCDVNIITEKFTAENSRAFMSTCDIIMDGSDNFETRFNSNRAAMQEKKPLISAAIAGFSAQLSVFKPYLDASQPCYRCLVPEIPNREISCAQEGVIGPLAGMLGSMQAMEVIKELLGLSSLAGSVLIIDALDMNIRKVTLPRDAACNHN